jgi:DNA-binding NarL/FixJ family response regulator
MPTSSSRADDVDRPGSRSSTSRCPRVRRGRGPLSGLDEDEVELLALIADGTTDEKIGEQLGLSLDEVHDATGRLFARLGLHGSPDKLRRIVAVLEVLRA